MCVVSVGVLVGSAVMADWKKLPRISQPRRRVVLMEDVAGLPRCPRRVQEPGSSAKSFPTHVLRPGQKIKKMAPKATTPVKKRNY